MYSVGSGEVVPWQERRLLNRKLYSKSIELKTKYGIGAIRIARLLSDNYSLDIPPRTVGHWLSGDRSPRQNNVFKEEPSPQLSYVIGAACGDGSLIPKSSTVKIEVTDRDFAEHFNVALSELFRRDSKNKILMRHFSSPRRLPLYVVRYSSRQLFQLLQRPLNDLCSIIRAYPREFLRGFFDAEGYASVSASGKLSVSVGVENTDIEALTLIRTILLEEFDIKASLAYRRPAGSSKTIRSQSFKTRNPVYSLQVRKRQDVAKFLVNIGFSISRKIEKLRDAVRLLDECDSSEAANRWTLLYEKRAGKWATLSS